ncbi:MAG: carboxypeptidase regulatory-like domain-containing protein [Acidobacteria bacterium]|nr:carboxypeptidase regulatory-like domain-containing protein [Acidobacteriota bacterium]
MSFRSGLLVVLAAVLAICAGRAHAQSSDGAIAGSVVDATGALIPGAKLSAVGADNGTTYTTVSNSAGAFRFSNMAIGRYNVTASAPGFNATTSEGVLVQVNSTAALAITMKTGSTETTVSVNSDAPTVETQSSDIGSVVATRQIIDLPLSLGGQGATRSPEAFVFLTPGTVGPGSAGNSNGAFESKIAGGQNFGAEVLVDGASTQRADSASAFDQTAPSVEALQEFKVTTSTIPAEFGRTTGGVESFSIKSGSNAYHGTIYDIFQNEDMNANDYFNKLRISQNPTSASNLKNNARSLDRKNDYGGTLGGPVVIPKLYNGKDKTFFFFSYEQFRQNQSGTSINTMPTAAVRGGDFTSLLTNTPTGSHDCNGNPVYKGEILDPNTTSTLPNGNPCRLPFATMNVIPTARFSQVAQNLLNYLPLPNLPGATQNFVYSSASPILNSLMSIRIDQNLKNNSKLYASYSSRDNVSRNGNPGLPDPIANNGQFAEQSTHYVRIGWDDVILPSLLNHFNVGYNRVASPNHSGAVNGTDWPAKLGIKNANGPTFPVFNFASNVGYTSVGQDNDAIQDSNALLFNDAVTISKGPHDIRIGLDWRNEQLSVANFAGESGDYNFQRYETAAAPSDNTTGDGFASFLLGQVDTNSFNIQSTAPRFVSNYYGGYVEDNYKVAHNLLLNLGFRYDVETPRHESHGNVSNFDPTLPNTGAGNLPGALVFAGQGAGRNGTSGAFAKTWMKDFAPRLGFAYSPDAGNGKTAVRGGFGIYYGPLDYADFGTGTTLGFSAAPNFHNPNNFTEAYAGGVDAGIPAYKLPPNLDPTQANGQGGSGFGGLEYIAPSYGRPSMTLNWSLQVQQQLATDLILTIGYVGQSSSHLRSSLAQINDLNPANFVLGSGLSQPATNLPYAGFSGTVAQSLRPFPQYQSINTDCCLENLGHSSYSAMLVSLERRFHSGLNLMASYTWSKTLTDADSALPVFANYAGGGGVQNPYNLKGEKALSNQDLPQTLVLSYIYELPVGKGRKFLGGANTAVNAVVGGWQVGGVQRYESGQPLSFAGAPTSVPSFDGTIRYNQVAPIRNPNFHGKVTDPLTQTLFNKAAFQDPNANVKSVPGTPYVFGDLPRTTGEMRSNVYLGEDASVIKNIADFGRYGTLLLHMDAFNLLNRHIFNRPDTNPTDQTFGQYTGDLYSPRTLQAQLRYTF